MLRFCLLGSGSTGNALLVASPTTKVLIDNGFSLKQLEVRAAAVGESLDDVDALFVTHEHSDHVNGVGVAARRLGVPVFMTPGTAESLPVSVGGLPQLELFDAGDTVSVGDMTLTSFPVSHDAADPVNFVVQSGGAKLGLAADLGRPSHLVRNRLAGAHALVLEANHCPDMLRRGSYPLSVQQRILSRHGHLSNKDMGTLLASLVHDRLEIVVLVHLSQENNTRRLAHAMASRIVANHPAKVYVAWQDKPTRVFEIQP